MFQVKSFLWRFENQLRLASLLSDWVLPLFGLSFIVIYFSRYNLLLFEVSFIHSYKRSCQESGFYCFKCVKSLRLYAYFDK